MSPPLRFCCAYLEMMPNLIHKDVGQIPYALARDLGWKSQLVFWEREKAELIEPPDYSDRVKKVDLGHSSTPGWISRHCVALPCCGRARRLSNECWAKPNDFLLSFTPAKRSSYERAE